MIKSERIETIKKRFKNEWLLIRVDKAAYSRPTSGRIIDHNADRTVIYKEIAKHNSKYPVLVTYSQDKLPKGYAAAFSLHV